MCDPIVPTILDVAGFLMTMAGISLVIGLFLVIFFTD